MQLCTALQGSVVPKVLYSLDPVPLPASLLSLAGPAILDHLYFPVCVMLVNAPGLLFTHLPPHMMPPSALLAM